MEYHSPMRKKEILLFVTIRADFERIILNEIGQTKKKERICSVQNIWPCLKYPYNIWSTAKGPQYLVLFQMICHRPNKTKCLMLILDRPRSLLAQISKWHHLYATSKERKKENKTHICRN